MALQASRRLKKQLGLFDVFAISPGAMFSSGFFLLPGLAAADTGPSVVIAYFFAGIFILTPLEDQHVAGLIMWIPGGAVYLAAPAARRRARWLASWALISAVAGVMLACGGRGAADRGVSGGDPARGPAAAERTGADHHGPRGVSPAAEVLHLCVERCVRWVGRTRRQ